MKTKIKMQFDPYVASVVGVDCSIMLSNIEFWVETNEKNKINFHEGKYWMYNSINAFCELFPFWSEQNIKTILSKLIKHRYIKKGKFNKKGYDKTSWYTLDVPSVEPVRLELTNHQLELTNPLVSSNQPIPDNKPDDKQQIKIISTQEEKTGPAEPILVEAKPTLPEKLGRTYITRLLTVYKRLFVDKFGFEPTINVSLFGKTCKELCEAHSEVQLAAMMIIFFNWNGMNGGDARAQQRLVEATFPITWFKNGINTYEAYARNVFNLDLDKPEELLQFLRENLPKSASYPQQPTGV